MICAVLCSSHAPWSSCPKSTELSRKALPLETWRPTLFLGEFLNCAESNFSFSGPGHSLKISAIKFRLSRDAFIRSSVAGWEWKFKWPRGSRRCVTLTQSQVTGGGGRGHRGQLRWAVITSRPRRPCSGGEAECAPGALSGNTARADHKIHWLPAAGIFLQRHAVKSLWSRKK